MDREREARLTGALIGLARATDGSEHLITAGSTQVIVDGLCATVPHGNADGAVLDALLDRVREAKRDMVPNCFSCASPCGRTDDYDLRQLWQEGEEVRSLKALLLSGIRSMAACASAAAEHGWHDEEVERFFYKALIVIGMEGWDARRLLPILVEMGRLTLRCMELPQG